jgi:hypothetical protein
LRHHRERSWVCWKPRWRSSSLLAPEKRSEIFSCRKILTRVEPGLGGLRRSTVTCSLEMVHEWRVNHACAVVNATTSVRGVPCNLGICRMGILAGTSAAACPGARVIRTPCRVRHNENWRMRQSIESIGAGEGNRTLVFSLEGFRRLNTFNARSDKNALSAPIEPKRLFGAVRMMARAQAISVAIITTIIKRESPGAVISRSEAKKKAWHYHRGHRTYETRKHSARAQTRITC